MGTSNNRLASSGKALTGKAVMGRPRKPMRVTLLDEATLERLAHIVGDQSAARLALDDLARRRAAGENSVAVQHGESILVVPRADLIPAGDPSPAPQSDGA